ncbi:pyridoxal phosphate-dependent transferase [Chytriomyces cf. hyalinus JEL632]|nr:pyridoxal phosphate-dependent transferase [Chytriomyces cf. hyalinus JEL632]
MASLNSKPPHANSNKSALDNISYTDEMEMESTDSDEGFDSDFADAHPLYSRASGLQFMGLAASPEVPTSPTKKSGRGKESVRRASRPSEARASLTAAKEKNVGSTEPREHVNAGMEPGSQRNKDSVLHYFVATQDSELSLDLYLSRIISSFLDSPLPVFAGSNENPIVTQSRFSRHQVPRSNDDGTTLEEYLNAIKTNVIDRATRVASPKQIGHMTSALPYFHRPLAKLLTAMNQNVVKLETASTTTFLERETIAMMHHEFYGSKYPSSFYKHYMHSYDTALGVFTSGGTIANLTAMWVARNRALGPKPEVGFTGVDKEGLFAGLNVYGYKGAVILGSAMLHYSFKKAVDLLGLGDNGLGLVPVNDKFKMKIDALEEKIKEYQAKQFLIVSIIGIAGTTETGSIDDLEAIAQVAQKYKIHFHVDAAWGGPLIFSREHASKLAGVEKADSITIDGHKQLYTPMGLGLLLFSNPGMASSIRKTANYIIRKESADLGQFTLEGSRAAGSLHLHAVLHLLGRDGIESLVTRSATLVRQMAQRLSSHPAHAFQTLHDPETNILLYRYIPSLLRGKVAARAPLSEAEDELISEATRRIQARQATEGQQGFVSRTKVQVQRSGEKRWVDAFRVVLANPLTKWDDVEGVISEQQTVGVVIENEMVEEKHEGLSSKEKLVMWVGWPFEI